MLKVRVTNLLKLHCPRPRIHEIKAVVFMKKGQVSSFVKSTPFRFTSLKPYLS